MRSRILPATFITPSCVCRNEMALPMFEAAAPERLAAADNFIEAARPPASSDGLPIFEPLVPIKGWGPGARTHHSHMAGIQISGLLSNQAFDWKSVVDQLIAADSQPITKLNTDKTTNSAKIAALTAVQTSLQDLQDSVQAIRTGNIFASRNVTSDTANTTWQPSSPTGASTGSSKFAVTRPPPPP